MGFDSLDISISMIEISALNYIGQKIDSAIQQKTAFGAVFSNANV